MGIAKSFERKFLLGWGRHLWNIVGVSGFVAVLTGGVLFINSAILKTPKSFAQYLLQDIQKVRTEVENLEKELKDQAYLDQKDIALSSALRAKKINLLYDKQQQLRNVDQGYEQYKKKIERENDFKLGQRVISPFIAGYGLAVIASASVSTALLSIERNTRKD